jgi:hypothetical protein
MELQQQQPTTKPYPTFLKKKKKTKPYPTKWGTQPMELNVPNFPTGHENVFNLLYNLHA